MNCWSWREPSSGQLIPKGPSAPMGGLAQMLVDMEPWQAGLGLTSSQPLASRC